MKVAIAAFLKRFGGPRTYARELVWNLAKLYPAQDVTVICDAPRSLEKSGALPEGIRLRVLPLGSPYQRPLWDHVRLRRTLRQFKPDVFHHTKEALPWACPVPSVVTFFDLSFRKYPETFTLRQRALQAINWKFALSRCHSMISVSRATARDIQDVYGVDSGRVRVIYPGVGSEFRPVFGEQRRRAALELGIETPAIGFLGTWQPRKNLGVLLAAWERLVRKERLPHRLVLAGRRGWLWSEMARLIERSTLRDRIQVLGGLADWQRPLFYAALDCFVAPSLYEGFGLTLVEALACGTPAVASRTAGHTEVVEEGALLVDPNDVSGWVEALAEVLLDPAKRKNLVERGLKQAARFSWDRCARETFEVYQRAASGAR